MSQICAATFTRKVVVSFTVGIKCSKGLSDITEDFWEALMSTTTYVYKDCKSLAWHVQIKLSKQLSPHWKFGLFKFKLCSTLRTSVELWLRNGHGEQ